MSGSSAGGCQANPDNEVMPGTAEVTAGLHPGKSLTGDCVPLSMWSGKSFTGRMGGNRAKCVTTEGAQRCPEGDGAPMEKLIESQVTVQGSQR